MVSGGGGVEVYGQDWARALWVLQCIRLESFSDAASQSANLNAPQRSSADNDLSTTRCLRYGTENWGGKSLKNAIDPREFASYGKQKDAVR